MRARMQCSTSSWHRVAPRGRAVPLVPADPPRLQQDCYEAYNIQVSGLEQRLRALNYPKMELGLSGGLDSTHALIVAARTMAREGPPRSHILAVTLEPTGGVRWSALSVLDNDVDRRAEPPVFLQAAEPRVDLGRQRLLARMPPAEAGAFFSSDLADATQSRSATSRRPRSS